MYDAKPLKMDELFPALIFDSTGALMYSMGIEGKYGILLPLDEFRKFAGPRGIYEHLRKQA